MSTQPALNGCHNRKPFKTTMVVQDGYFFDGQTRIPKMVTIPFVMTADCQYTLSDTGQQDQRCNGCRWRKPPAQ